MFIAIWDFTYVFEGFAEVLSGGQNIENSFGVKFFLVLVYFYFCFEG